MDSTSHTRPPLTPKYVKLSFPKPSILLVTLNRPKQLNCINIEGHEELEAIWRWMDDTASLSVGVVTGEGRAFCAGADLKGEAPLLLLLRPFVYPSIFWRRGFNGVKKDDT